MTPTTASPARTDQASRLRDLVASLRDTDDTPRPSRHPIEPQPIPRRRPAVPIIAIGSGKGGVGKTCLGVNLAAALCAAGSRPVLIDADLGSANADVLLGLTPARRLDRALTGAARLEQLLITGPGGIGCIPGVVGRAELATPLRIERLIDGMGPLDQHCDTIIVDTAAGNSDAVRALLRHADLALIVAIPEPTSIADAYALIKLLRHDLTKAPQPHTPEIALVVNQADATQAKRVVDRIASVCDRFLGWQPTCLGRVSLDRHMVDSVRARRPVKLTHPEASASRAITSLASTIRDRFGLSS